MNRRASDISLKFTKVDDGYYAVSALGIHIGHVYRDLNAWSYGSWMIEGRRACYTHSASSCGKITKRIGFTDRCAAGYELAIMQSSTILAQMVGA